MAKSKRNPNEGDANKDPITGEPGAHPVGAGLARRLVAPRPVQRLGR